MSKEAYFTIGDNPDKEKLETIWFWDEVVGCELLASDIRAFLDFRLQIQMMAESGNECSFRELVQQAKDLEATFNECLKVLKKK